MIRVRKPRRGMYRGWYRVSREIRWHGYGSIRIIRWGLGKKQDLNSPKRSI